MARSLKILENSTLLRQWKRFQKTMTTPYLDDDLSENDDPYIDEDGNIFANEQIVSDIDDDLVDDDGEYHEAHLGYREARELMKEARGARIFYPFVVPIRSGKPTGKGKGDS